LGARRTLDASGVAGGDPAAGVGVTASWAPADATAAMRTRSILEVRFIRGL
jgi:hypothetical protein